jgi:hypothetical protein
MLFGNHLLNSQKKRKATCMSVVCFFSHSLMCFLLSIRYKQFYLIGARVNPLKEHLPAALTHDPFMPICLTNALKNSEGGKTVQAQRKQAKSASIMERAWTEKVKPWAIEKIGFLAASFAPPETKNNKSKKRKQEEQGEKKTKAEDKKPKLSSSNQEARQKVTIPAEFKAWMAAEMKANKFSESLWKAVQAAPLAQLPCGSFFLCFLFFFFS